MKNDFYLSFFSSFFFLNVKLSRFALFNAAFLCVQRVDGMAWSFFLFFIFSGALDIHSKVSFFWVLLKPCVELQFRRRFWDFYEFGSQDDSSYNAEFLFSFLEIGL